MNLDKNHDKAFNKIHEEHEDLITTLITYMDSRRENAKTGEISFQHNHKMICISPDTNRGPFWAVEGLNAWFTLQAGERFNFPMRIYTVGYCLNIYSETKTIRMLINDVRSEIRGKEILIPLEHIGRYFLSEKSDDYYNPSLELKKYLSDEDR